MSIDRTTADPLAEAGPAETDKRRQILDGAREVFLASGFDGASMGAIAKAAGVSKGTLYVYFESKESLFEALTIEEKRSLAETSAGSTTTTPTSPPSCAASAPA